MIKKPSAVTQKKHAESKRVIIENRKKTDWYQILNSRATTRNSWQLFY